MAVAKSDIPTLPTVLKNLDRNRNHGQVYGSVNGAVWEQDGVLFDHSGREISSKVVSSIDDTDDFPDPPTVKTGATAQ